MTTRLVALAALLLFSFGIVNSLQAAAPVEPLVVSPVLVAPAASISSLLAQGEWPTYPSMGAKHDIIRGSGGYFSWIKLLLVVIVFFVWVRFTDWINRDAIRFHQHTEMHPDIVNPLVVLTFVAGFLAVLCIPSFIAGFPVYAIAAFLPYTIYMMQRKGKIPSEAFSGELFAEDVEAKTDVPIDLKAAGSDADESKSNLIKARQSPAYETTCQLLHNATVGGTDQVLMDYSREAVVQRMQVDGMWHQMPTIDRETGDGMLYVMKVLAGLNPADRRSVQRGIINGKVDRAKVKFDMTSQGTQTGERVLIKIAREETLKLELPDLGMTEEMQAQLLERVAGAGMVIISSPVGQGLSSTWQGVLNGSDRFTRDFVGIADPSDMETERENIEIKRLKIEAGESPVTLLKTMILKQPDAFIFPKIPDAATMDVLTDQVNNENRTLVTRVQAGSSVEAALRLMSVAGDRAAFAKSLVAVTNQRLVRRLCDACKKPVQANPQAIQQMGGNPQTQSVLYKDYQLPPPEHRVDEAGKPIIMEPCNKCNGLGFKGRMAIFELLLVDPQLREILAKTPKMDVVAKAAAQRGNLTLIQQAYRSVLEGKTSMAEVQRVFQQQGQQQRQRPAAQQQRPSQ